MKLLVLDNYDSFTYNLVHYVEEILNQEVDVYRNDEITVNEVGKYDKILLSPGPGIPDEAGILKEIIKTHGNRLSIFGVCLGCQAIAEVYGGSIRNLSKVYHGVSTDVHIDVRDDIIFKGIPDTFSVGRYHSWVVNEKELPQELIITSRDSNGEIMSLMHKTDNVRGVQFHPESVLTEHGKLMIKNWLS